MTNHQQFIVALADAIRARAPLPPFPAGVTMDEAYRMLPAAAARVCDSGTSGLKAGLTNPELQALFGLDEALIGLLYDWGECPNGVALPFREYARIECELAVVLSAEDAPVALAPAIEIVHLNFAAPEDFTPANLVMSSLGADSYICGSPIPWGELDQSVIRSTAIKLERDGELLQLANAGDSLNGPERAVDWCVNEARKRSLEIADGTTLLTGTCGDALPGLPGNYKADFGELGTLRFTIETPAG